MRTQTTKRLIAGMLTIGMIGLLRSQPLFALPVSQAQPNPSQDYVSLFCHSPGGQSPEALSVNQYKLSY